MARSRFNKSSNKRVATIVQSDHIADHPTPLLSVTVRNKLLYKILPVFIIDSYRVIFRMWHVMFTMSWKGFWDSFPYVPYTMKNVDSI